MTRGPAIFTSRWPLAASLLFCLLAASAQASNPRNQVDFYIETYGKVASENNPLAARAHGIFDQLKRVTGGSNRSLFQLEVVNSPTDPWAISLPDGHIVLSRGALELCGTLKDVTDACIAFILGHELAHIANNDFWHQEVSRFLSTSSDNRSLAKRIRNTADKELKADDDGFIYAAMAGYPVDKLLEVGSGDSNFFHYWSKQTTSYASNKDPVLNVRASLLRERLTQISQQIGFFQFGVRLAHFDYCDDAVYFFSNFQKVFPGREVLNNLGYCYLQIARQQMAPARAYFYWMPLQLDGETRAASLSQRGGKSPGRLRDMAIGDERRSLDLAIDYLQQAVDSDPWYLPARINLAVAYLYSNHPHKARAVLDEARALAPDNLEIQGLEALAIYEQSDSEINLLPNALARLRDLAAKNTASDVIVYNLVRLSELAGSGQHNRDYIDQLLSDGERLPTPVLQAVCEVTGPGDTRCQQHAAETPTAIAALLPIPDSGWQQVSPEVRQRLDSWNRQPFDWGSANQSGSIYRSGNRESAVLVMDNFVQMQVISGAHVVDFDALQKYCPSPLRKRVIAAGELWSCGNWAALTNHHRVNELWWVAR